MALRTEGPSCSPDGAIPEPKKRGLRRRLSRLFSRSEVSLEERQSGRNYGDWPRLASSKDPPDRCDTDKRKMQSREQRAFRRVSKEEEGFMCASRASESPSPSTSQKSAPKTHALSYSEPNLWRNGFLRRFGSLAWRKRRGSHLELSERFPASDPWLCGRLQRPAVGSDLDMRSRFDMCPAECHSGEQENLELSSYPHETDSAETSLALSTSFNSLLCWGEGESGMGSFSLSMSSVHCPTSPEPIDEITKHPSVQEKTSRTPEPLLEWAEHVCEAYLTSGNSFSTTGGLGGLSFGSSLRESASEQVIGAEGPTAATSSLHVEQAPQAAGAASAVPTGPPKDASKVCYAVVITLTKAEEEDGQGEPAGSGGGRGLRCHMPGEATLSLGVAELEKATERRHQKPARPAPQLSEQKECQNCRRLQRVGTSQVSVPTPATGSLVARREGSEPRLRQSEDQSGTEPLRSRDGLLAEAPSTVGPGSLADSSSKLYLATNIPSKKLCDTEKAPSSMEKGTGGSRSRQNKAGVSVVSALFGRKKMAAESPKDDIKLPSGKGSAVSRTKERAGARTSSPSKVSMLLEAWEKGLVGTESGGASSSADFRRSRSPVPTRRLLSSKDASHPLSPGSTKSSLSPANARRSIFSADTSQSPSPASTRQSHSPGETRSSFSRSGTRGSSPVDIRRPLSPADSRQLFSLSDTRQSLSPAETRRSFSPLGTRRSSSPADTRRSHSPADTRRPHSPEDSLQSHFLEDTRYSSSTAGAQRLSSLGQTQYSSLAADNHGSSSPVDKPYSSFLPDSSSSYSVADIRRLYCPEDSRPSSSPANARRRSSSPAGTRSPLSSPASTRSPLSSPAGTRSPFSPADVRPLSSLSDVKSYSSPRVSRSFSPISDGRRSRSLSPRREFTSHGPVFSQVYSPVSKPKSLTGTDVQDVNGTTEENHSLGASAASLTTGIQRESHIANTGGFQKEGLLPSNISARMLESQKEHQRFDGASSGAAPGSLRVSHPPNATVLRFQTESYTSRAANHITSLGGSIGENETPSTVNTKSSVGPSALNPLPHMVSTVAESQAQWYGSKGSGTVVYRSEQQVVLPQAGRATVYRAGREIIMSSAGIVNAPQQEKSPFSSSASNAFSKDNLLQLQDGLTDAKSPKGSLTAISDASNSSPVESWLESCMTQPRSATVSDTQRQRCVLLPNPAFTSKEDANTLQEEVVSLSTLQDDCRTQSKAASQRLSSPFTASRSERAKSMPEPRGPAENGPELESIRARIERITSSGSSEIWSGSDAGGPAGEIKTLGAASASQESTPGDPKSTTQTVLRKEQSDPPKDSQVSPWEPTSPFADSNPSHEPLSQETGSSSKTAEEEPEEAVDMELFVDTLRNMEPPEPRKPLKLPTRPPRPSKLAKHVPLPPIHEHHATPKSNVPLPAALGELFTLAEERNLEEEKGGKEKDGELVEEMEEIVNPYPSKDETLHYDLQVRKLYPWENQLYKTEEEIGSFLGKLQQGSGYQKSSTATKAVVGPNNFIRANVLKGISLVSDFADKKGTEEKPYSRLDNSLLYSKFICPEKSQFRPVENGKEGKYSPIPLIPAVLKVNRECQTSPNGLLVKASEELRSTLLLPAPREETSSVVPSANGDSSQISLMSNEILPQNMEKKTSKINVRPGKIILYSESGFGGQKREIWGDITDATSWELTHTISIRVVRGGWVMYEKPRFHGRKCVLAEGDVEITNPWKMYRRKGPAANTPFLIGSLKRIVRDYRIPEIALFTEEHGEGAKWRFTDSSEDTRICNLPLKAASIIVHSGLWLVYSKPFYDDDPYVLEPGGYPNLQAWGAKDASVCSLHPIKLGCPVVEKPGEPKALIYEEPHFQGHSWEVSRDIYDVKKPENNQDSKMSTVGSLKILGGCWVGYEKEGFRGHQYLLEEGEYRSWSQWGGFNEHLVSLRLIRTDFLDPALVLFEAMDFEDGPSVELCEALPDVELASYGSTTQSIHVLSGVWVAYEEKNFTGEQYILEKGVYRNCEDWGASNCQISSVQPILQVGEHSLHFISKLQLFSDPNFLGKHISFTEDQASLPENFIPHSCRVHGGSWILYDSPQFDGEQHVLSEGEYPSLTSMGCLITTAIRSLKKVPIFFSEPSIFLHGLECFEGKEIELNSEVRSLQAEGFNNHVLSVRVKGGIWVLCEHSDFRGRQWLLNCMEITNWLTYSGLQHIGSLYPIRQKRIYFRIKNEELKSFLSVPDDVEDMKAGRVLVSELSDKISSIWYYEEGILKNQVAPGMSLQVIGPAGKGAKVVLWSESRVPRQTWQVDSFGRICSQMFEDKVLDVKGGRTYDRDHAILWELSEKRPTQIWDVQVL